MAKGCIVEILRPGQSSLVATVMYAIHTTVVLRSVAPLAHNHDNVTMDADNPWTMKPVGCENDDLARLLGLGTKDLASWTPLPIVQSSGLRPDHRMVVGLGRRHGLMVGDPVVLDGFVGGSLVNGVPVRVERSLSPYYVELSVTEKKLVLHDQNRVLRFFVRELMHEVTVVIIHAATARASAEEEEMAAFTTMVEVEAAPAFKESLGMKRGEWYAVQMLPPIPSMEWVDGNVHCMWKGGNLLVFSVAVRESVGPNTCLIPMSVVGPLKMALFDQEQVVFLRLRLGPREVFGVVSLLANNRHVFGRAQLRRGPMLSATDLSVVGHCAFHPPLERVPYIEVAFLNADGHPLPPTALGNFSLLLRCQQGR